MVINIIIYVIVFPSSLEEALGNAHALANELSLTNARNVQNIFKFSS
jgi:hypothetical protein